jgi:hypothetical protein
VSTLNYAVRALDYIATPFVPPGGGAGVRSTSTSGVSDSQSATRAIPVPAGIQIGDTVVAAIELWDSTATNPTLVTPAGAWTLIVNYASTTDGFQKLKVWLKPILVGEPPSTWSFTGLGNHFSQGAALCLTGLNNASLLDGTVHLAQTASGTSLPANTKTTTAADAVIHVMTGENSSTATPPTSFTEDQDGNYLKINHKIQTSAGTETISSGSVSASTLLLGSLFGLKPVVSASPLTVNPTAITSAEAFGTAVVIGPQTASPTGIASAEAFGTPQPSPPFVASIAGSGVSQYPADQYGQPILIKGDVVWAFPVNAGRWGGTYQSVFTNYLDTRLTQNFNLVMIGALGSTQNGGPSDTGTTYDGVSPWAAGVKGSLNDPYWQRIDYFIDEAAVRGMTVLLNVAYSYDMDNAALNGATAAQYTSYGTALGNRYKNKPNLVWGVGGDYFDGQITQLNNLFNAIKATGDTHLISVQNYPETTSRKDISTNSTNSTGTSWSNWNFVYSYNVTYDGVDYAYDEASPICVIWGDGHFYQNSTGDRKVYRDLTWWAYSSGARGHIHGSEGIWNWGSTAASNLTENVAATDLPNIWKAFTGMKGWHKLASDTNSSFVTSGRGTHAAALSSGGGGGQYDSADPQDQYVSAGVAADGSIAVLYFPVNKTVTVTPTELTSPYNVRWVDPTNGTSTPQAVSSTYTPTGSNALGGADWLLVFETASAPTGIASSEAFGAPTATQGTGSTNTSPTGISSAEAFGTAVRTSTLAVSTTGITTVEAFGTQAASATLTTSPTAITSAEAFGTQAANASLTSSPTGISTAEAFGTAARTSTLTASPTGVASAEQFGTPNAGNALVLQPTGIPSAQALGVPAATVPISAQPVGITTAEQFGTSAAGGTLATQPIAVGSGEAFGSAAMSGLLSASPTGISSAEALGLPTRSGLLGTQPTGIGSGEAVGQPVGSFGALSTSPTGVPTQEAFGAVEALSAGQTSPDAIPSAEAFGTPSRTSTLTSGPQGIASAEQFGIDSSGTVLTTQPTGIPSAQAMGTPATSGVVHAQAVGISSAEGLGAPAIILTVQLSPAGVVSEEAFGALTATGGVPATFRDLELSVGLVGNRYSPGGTGSNRFLTSIEGNAKEGLV